MTPPLNSPENPPLIQPALCDEEFLTDVLTAREEPDRLHLWWLGQSGFLVQWQRSHLLLDPYLSDSLTEKYAATDKPHVRMTARVVDPARLTFIDVVSSSHNHTDHLDAATLAPLLNVNPGLSMVAPEANRSFAAERLGIDPERILGMDAGQTVRANGFTFYGVPAAHETVERDEQGRCRFLGYIVKAGPYSLYHSGDTVLYEGMAEGLSPFRVDVALLPINGSAPERRVAGNLDGPQAAALAKAMGARLAIPCHYEMFEFNTASPTAFVQRAAEIGQPVQVLRAGERFTVPEPGDLPGSQGRTWQNEGEL
ncbi:MAG: MBL fold metallo-hydrolase [Chloroflexi bacterium]|nr:MBL fold metallo-hydrolase [Chloroflexota bacterium]